MSKLHELRRERASLVTKAKAIVEKELPEGADLPEGDAAELEKIKTQVAGLDARIKRIEDVMEMEADGAKEIEDDEQKSEDGDEDDEGKKDGKVRVVKRHLGHRTFAAPKERYKGSLVVAGAMRMIGAGGGSIYNARQVAKEVLGESHPVTKALNASSGPTGGFIVPPDYVSEIIEILRARTVVRAAGPRTLAMPRGTMTLPRQTQAATANYGNELSAIPVSEQRVGQIVATYKKLTALVPVSNDLLRYSDPSADAFVRDDLVKVLALREDLAFIRGDGTADSPKGLRTFVQSGQIISSTSAYTLSTVSAELGGAINRLESANVGMVNPVWIMHPRSKNYLLNVLNSNGFYVYKDEMEGGTLLGIPFYTTTQIPTNLVNSGDSDCSEVYLVDMDSAVIFDSMSMQIDVSREATYVDAATNTVSAFQSDQTLMRAITEHDFQMRQDAAIVVIQNVRWAPTIS